MASSLNETVELRPIVPGARRRFAAPGQFDYRRRVEGRDNASRGPDASISLARRRRISALLVLLLLASASQIVLRRDDWPLSSFAMFSGTASPVFHRIALVGVTADGEVDLPDSLFSPLAQARLLRALKTLHASGEDLGPVADFVQCRHESLGGRDPHGGARLDGIRFVRRSWDLDVSLANLDSPRFEVLFEARFPADEPGEGVVDREGPPAPGGGRRSTP